MAKRTSLLLAGCVGSLLAIAQPAKPVVVARPAMPTQPSFSYKKINPYLQYAFIFNKPTTQKPQEGDEIKINMQSVCNNRLMYSTYQAFKGKPATYGVNKPGFKGDLIEAIMMMTPGDSIVCLVDADVLFKNSKTKMPDFIKSGDKVQYFIKLVSIKPKEQVQKEQQAAFQKQMNEQMAKQKAAAAKQLIKDEKDLKDYFVKKKLTPIKTASGLYYTITEAGSGDSLATGDTVIMNYTGKLLDGTTFDSNEDTAFHHVQPFQFILGRGQVIRGWDEGIALLKTGSKGVLYIPSPMAYGAQARPGSASNPKGIPANSVLVFNVQVVSSKHPAPPAPAVPAATEAKVDSTVKPIVPQKGN